jgi:uncharacterized membrane protein
MPGYVAVVFDGKRAARNALDRLQDAATPYVWIDGAAVAHQGPRGAIHVDGGLADVQSCGTARTYLDAFRLIGPIGLLFGPEGPLAGATITAASGGLFGTAAKASMSDPRLIDVAKALTSDSSALLMVGADDALDAFVDTLVADRCRIIRSDLTGSDLRAIKKVLTHAA